MRAASIGVARNPLHKLLIKKYYVDEIYDALFVKPIYRLSLWLARVFDPGLIDGIVNGVGDARWRAGPAGSAGCRPAT